MRTIIWFIYFFGYMILHWPELNRGLKAQQKGDNTVGDALVTKHVAHWCNRLLELCGCEVTVTGRENIPKGRPCVFVANHRSYYDIPLVLTQLDAPHALVSKAEVDKIPLVRGWMRLLHCVFVQREDVRQSLKSLNEAAETVKEGYSMIIFPEGTRYKGAEGGMGEFKGGAFRIASKNKVPVIPVAIHNSRACLEGDGHFTMKPAKVSVHILPPIETENMSRTELKELPARAEAMVRADLQAGL